MPTYTEQEVDKIMRKRDIEEAGRAVASGRVVITPPISDEQQGLTKHSEFEVSVSTTLLQENAGASSPQKNGDTAATALSRKGA